jgi:branched-chain amino acid transport system substrate-binding protein
MLRRRFTQAFVLVAGFALLAGTATVAASSRGSQADSYKVGIVYSRTGLLAAYGAEYIEGLKIGLVYATGGTNKVNGHAIELNLQDDATNPTTGVSEAKDLIGQGYHILAGSTSSGVALQIAPLAAQNHVLFISGPAASDAITGANRYTFRSGRQTWQDVLAANAFLPRGSIGKNILVFAQDSAFGAGNSAAVSAVLGGKGHKVSKILVPLSANDFTPFAQQAKNANPDLIFVAWAGTTAGAMWQSLQQQGVLSSTKVVTGLAERATWQSFGAAGTQVNFLSHYVWNAPKSKVNDYLVKTMKKRGQLPDLFTPDGFVAAQMIVHALQKAGSDDPDKMVSALEGWRFTGPKGPEFVRPQDHALLQPMFQVKLVQKGSKWMDRVLGRISPGNLQPPVHPFGG